MKIVNKASQWGKEICIDDENSFIIHYTESINGLNSFFPPVYSLADYWKIMRLVICTHMRRNNVKKVYCLNIFYTVLSPLQSKIQDQAPRL